MEQTTQLENNPSKSSQTKMQFIVYTLVSLVTTIVELISFSLFNYLIFKSLSDQGFKLGFIEYTASNGGLTIFLSISLSFLIAQIFNFIVQRKMTFKANNHVLSSAVMYGIMITIIFILQMWLPTLIREPLTNVMRDGLADFIAKNMMMTLAFIIQFPINKWIIMRKIS